MPESPKDLADRLVGPDAWEADVLADVLGSLHPTTLLYGRLELGAPWAVRFPNPANAAGLYVIGRGGAELEVEGAPRALLSAGDIALLPDGGPHLLHDGGGAPSHVHVLGEAACRRAVVTDTPGRTGSPAGTSPAPLRLGGDGARTTLVAAAFRFGATRRSPLLEALPRVIHIEASDPRASPWLASTVQLLLAESAAQSPGGTLVVSRLIDVLLVHALRTWMTGEVCPEHGLRALVDPPIGRALQLVHARPGDDWTIERLARAVGLSRSAFAARFTDLVGVPPMEYVSRWRMTKAAELLRETGLPLIDVAERVGYASEAAFSRAFKQREGVSPAAYRRQELAGARRTES